MGSSVMSSVARALGSDQLIAITGEDDQYKSRAAVLAKNGKLIPAGTILVMRPRGLKMLQEERSRLTNLTLGQWGVHGTGHLRDKLSGSERDKLSLITVMLDRRRDPAHLERRSGPRELCVLDEILRIKASLHAERTLCFDVYRDQERQPRLQ